MSVLKTLTGKEYNCNFVGVSDNSVLYMQLEISFQEALNVFTDSNETAVLSWIGLNDNVIRKEEGFTEFGGFTITDGQCPVRVRMLKKIEVS